MISQQRETSTKRSDCNVKWAEGIKIQVPKGLWHYPESGRRKCGQSRKSEVERRLMGQSLEESNVASIDIIRVTNSFWIIVEKLMWREHLVKYGWWKGINRQYKSTDGTQLIKFGKMDSMGAGDRDVMSRLTRVFKSANWMECAIHRYKKY